MWNKQKAFSLLEVLVSVALLSLTLTLLFRGFIDFSNNSRKSENILYLGREMNALKKLLEQDLRSVVFLSSYTNDFQTGNVRYISGIQGNNKIIGSTAADQMFMHVHRESINFSDIPKVEDPKLHEVGYFVALKEANVYELYRTEQYYIDSKFNSYIGLISTANITKGKNIKNSLLTKNIINFNVRYLNNNYIWADDWNSISSQNRLDVEENRGRIPQAVEVEITLKRGENTMTDSFQINLRPPLAENVYWGNF